MKKYLITGLIVLSTSAVMADQRPNDDQSVTKEKKVDQLANELGLNDEQKIKIQASREKYRSQINEKQNAFNSAKDKFAQAVQSPTATTADIEALYKQHEDAHRALQDVIFKSRMDFREVLTPEQRTKMIVKQEDFRGKGPHAGKVPPPAPVLTK